MTGTSRATEPSSRANAEQVRARLRSDIFAGVYEPGEKLKFATLGQRYGASMGVLREALTALVEQRLVVAEPRIGFRVTPLSLPDLEDLTTARVAVETAAVRLGVATAPSSWEAEVGAAHRQLAAAPMLADGTALVRDEWESAHVRFHRAVVAGCGSPRLTDFADALRDSAELYRRWSAPLSAGRDVADEHRRIHDAVIARDGERAATALAEHYHRTPDVLRAARSGASVIDAGPGL